MLPNYNNQLTEVDFKKINYSTRSSVHYFEALLLVLN